MMLSKKKFDGVTLLEMLLVLVIVSSIILMIITYTNTKTDESKRDVTAMRYEQILNAGLAYYINNSVWPNDITTLKTNNYLPNKPIKNAWGQDFVFYQNLTTGTFSVCSSIIGRQIGSSYTSATQAGIIAGRLPMGYIAPGPCPANPSPYTVSPPIPNTCASTNCALVSIVNIPGQNLNNARSVNFAGLYHNGACVPAPVCPNASMKPAIMVVPASVSGTFFGNTDVYPLSSFTAYAVGSPTTVGTTNIGDPIAVPARCTSTSASPSTAACTGLTGAAGSGIYWRVCLDVVTENGRIGSPGSTWNETSGTIMAITRCVPSNEPSGSNFTVFQAY